MTGFGLENCRLRFPFQHCYWNKKKQILISKSPAACLAACRAPHRRSRDTGGSQTGRCLHSKWSQAKKLTLNNDNWSPLSIRIQSHVQTNCTQSKQRWARAFSLLLSLYALWRCGMWVRERWRQKSMRPVNFKRKERWKDEVNLLHDRETFIEGWQLWRNRYNATMSLGQNGVTCWCCFVEKYIVSTPRAYIFEK